MTVRALAKEHAQRIVKWADDAKAGRKNQTVDLNAEMEFDLAKDLFGEEVARALLSALEREPVTAEEVRDAALEEAAQAIEGRLEPEEMDGWEMEALEEAIDAVRALKSAGKKQQS